MHRKGPHFDIFDPTGQRFARLPQQVDRGRTEHQKPPRTPAGTPSFVNQATQHAEYLRGVVDFVQHHQLVGLGLQIKLWRRKPVPIGRRFQVEIDRRPPGRHRQGQRRLAHLPRADQPHSRLPGQCIS